MPGELDALVLDYGGVLTAPQTDLTNRFLTGDRIEPDSLRAVLREWLDDTVAEPTPVHRLETGHLPPAEFERLLAARLHTVDGGEVPSQGLLGRLFGAEAMLPEATALLTDARAAGLRTALLSNSWGNSYPMRELAELCDVVVISGEVGLRKPHPPIYRLVAERLGVPATRCAFVDDQQRNVTGAEAVGMRGVLHVDAATTRTALAAWVPALAPHREGTA